MAPGSSAAAVGTLSPMAGRSVHAPGGRSRWLAPSSAVVLDDDGTWAVPPAGAPARPVLADVLAAWPGDAEPSASVPSIDPMVRFTLRRPVVLFEHEGGIRGWSDGQRRWVSLTPFDVALADGASDAVPCAVELWGRRRALPAQPGGGESPTALGASLARLVAIGVLWPADDRFHPPEGLRARARRSAKAVVGRSSLAHRIRAGALEALERAAGVVPADGVPVKRQVRLAAGRGVALTPWPRVRSALGEVAPELITGDLERMLSDRSPPPSSTDGDDAVDEGLALRTKGNSALLRVPWSQRPNVDQRRRAYEALAHDERPSVWSVDFAANAMPALGSALVMAYARVHDGGRLARSWAIRPAAVVHPGLIDRVLDDHGAGLFLFGDYVWNVEANLEISERIKQRSPGSIVVHGGPSAPKYEGDLERWLARHPWVDVVVRGEAEVTVAEALAALDGRLDDLRPLRDVPGLSVVLRSPLQTTVHRTPDRPRMADLSVLPSPYLEGDFDHLDLGLDLDVVLETNRGCPYGCTFCDWGSATQSRIRKFPLDRVKAEITWAAEHRISSVFVADANVGIFARDVDIARHLVAERERTGFPQRVTLAYAKNTAKHLQEIVELLIEAGVYTEGSTGIQSTDPATLAAIDRKNLPDAEFARVRDAFRQRGLPFWTDFMIGLPGATVDSWADDLQFCFDHDLLPHVLHTVVLANSPMNEPGYRQRWAIETDARGRVRSTSTFTEDDLEQMWHLAALYRIAEGFGVFRLLVRWVHQRRGDRPIDVLRALDDWAAAEPSRSPCLAFVLDQLSTWMVPPGGWEPLADELAVFLAERYGLDDDPGELEAVLAAQAAVLPVRGRRYPYVVDLPHDIGRWWASLSDDEPIRLATLPPAAFEVDDPAGVAETLLIRNRWTDWYDAYDNAFWNSYRWELVSSLQRQHRVPQSL